MKKEMKKLFVILFALLLVGCAPNDCDFSKEIQEIHASREKRAEDEILFLRGHELYYTILKTEYGDGRFIIQDFYATGERYSDSYVVLSLKNVVTNNLWDYNHRKDIDGWLVLWHKNGQMLSKEHYNNGVLHGAFSIWREDGSKVTEGYYVNGEKSGIWKDWDRNGNLTREIDYGLPNKS